MLFLTLTLIYVMQNPLQHFDRSINEYIDDANILGVLSSADSAHRIGLSAAEDAELQRDLRAASDAISAAFQTLDPSKGSEHESAAKKTLINQLDEIEKRVASRLTREQITEIRRWQKEKLGYAYLFVIDEPVAILNEEQKKQRKH